MGDPRRVPNFSKPRSGLAQWSSVVQHTRIDEVRCTGPTLSGPVPSNGSYYTRARCSVQEEYPPLNPSISNVDGNKTHKTCFIIWRSQLLRSSFSSRLRSPKSESGGRPLGPP